VFDIISSRARHSGAEDWRIECVARELVIDELLVGEQSDSTITVQTGHNIVPQNAILVHLHVLRGPIRRTCHNLVDIHIWSNRIHNVRPVCFPKNTLEPTTMEKLNFVYESTFS
jgi:hypothetical protein